MPTAVQLADRIRNARDNAHWSLDPSITDPYEVFDRYLVDRIGTRADLTQFLESVFRPDGKDPKPGVLHHHLAELAAADTFPAIIDTNYDLLLRRAMMDIKASHTHAVLERNLTLTDEGCRYLSLHGSLDDWRTTVLTTGSYAEWERRYRFLQSQLDVLLFRHPVLFVGCSMRDARLLDWLRGLDAGRREGLRQWMAIVSPGTAEALKSECHDGVPIAEMLAEHVQMVELRDHAELPSWFGRLAEPARRARMAAAQELTIRIAAESRWTVRFGEHTRVVDPPDLGDELTTLRRFACAGLPLQDDGTLDDRAATAERAMHALAMSVGTTIAGVLPAGAIDAIAACVAAVAARGSCLLRIVVSGSAADEALLLPWETLAIDGRHPVAEGEIDLVREAWVDGSPAGLPDPAPPLTVVAHLAAPEGDSVPPLDLEAAAFRMARALDGISERTRFTELGTVDDLREAVTDIHPVVVHFAGHGVPGHLVFEDTDGGPDTVPVDRVVESLRHPDGRLPGAVWLSCCFGAGAGPEPGAGGAHTPREWGVGDRSSPVIAAELHRRGIPQVLGYFGPVPDPLAVEVDRTLFETLRTSGRTLGAVRNARQRTRDPIETASGRMKFPLAWSLLGLYHRGPDIPLVSRTEPLPSSAKRALERRPIALHGLQVLEHGFIGRRRLLASLRRLHREGERTIGLFGLGGLGKTATMIRLARILHGSDGEAIARDVVVLPLAVAMTERPSAESALEWLQARVDAALIGHPRAPEQWSMMLGTIDTRPDRGRALAELVLAAARGATIYIDNAETVQVDMTSSGASHGESRGESDGDSDRVGWVHEEITAFFATLAERASEFDATILMTTRYRPAGIRGVWKEIPPCSIAEIFRMLGWFPTLHRLPVPIRSRLAEERLNGHPRSVEWLDGLLAEEEGRSGRRFGSDDPVASVERDFVTPALEGIPAKAESDLLLSALIERLAEAPRALLGECTAIGIPVPREAIALLGNGVKTLIDRGLLTRYEDDRFAVHPLVTAATEKLGGGSCWTRAGRASLGEWWYERVNQGATLLEWIEALGHLVAGEAWESAFATLETICEQTRRFGWVRTRLDVLEQAIESGWPARHLGQIVLLHSDAMYDIGRYADAAAAARRSVEIKMMEYRTRAHPDVAVSLNGLANALVRQDRSAEAESAYREAISILEKAYGTRARHDVAGSLSGLANALVSQGQYAEAESAYRESIEIIQMTYGTRAHPDLAAALTGLAAVLAYRDRPREAELAYRESIDIKERAYPTRAHPELAASLHGLAGVLTRERRFAEAESAYLEAIEIGVRVYGTRSHPQLLPMLANLSGLLQQMEGRGLDAAGVAKEAFDVAIALGLRIDAVHCGAVLCYALARDGRRSEAMACRAEIATMLGALPVDHPVRKRVEQELQLGGGPSEPSDRKTAALNAFIAVCQATIDARRAGTVPPPLAADLTEMKGVAAPWSTVAAFLEAVANGAAVPPVPADLPSPFGDILTKLAEAAQ